MANYMTAIREIEQIVDNAPELNMNNYDEIQVDELNSAMIEICNILGNLAECESKEAEKRDEKALILSDVSISLPSDEEIREPIQNAIYATGSYTTDQCTEFADGILTYLTEAGYKVVRQ